MSWYLLSAINGNLYFLEIRTQVLSVNPVSDCRLFFKNSYLNQKLYNLKLSSHAKKAQKRVQKIKKKQVKQIRTCEITRIIIKSKIFNPGIQQTEFKIFHFANNNWGPSIFLMIN